MLVQNKGTVLHRNYLIQVCSRCHQEMELSEGDVIFDGKWYHKHCWSVLLENRAKVN